jgi:hypothetical protein
MPDWTPVSEHRWRLLGYFKLRWALFLLALFFFGLGVGLLFVPWKPGEAALGYIFCTLMALGGGAGLAFCVWEVIRRVSSVRVYQQGIGWVRGGEDRQYPWEAVKEVYRKEQHVLQGSSKPSDWNRTSDLKLVFQDGGVVHFNHAQTDYNRLCELVQGITAQHLTPAKLKELQAGEAAFGPVRVSNAAIASGKVTLPWDAVQSLMVANGRLLVNQGPGKYQETMLSKIPNYLVLFHVLESLGRPVESPK